MSSLWGGAIERMRTLGTREAIAVLEGFHAVDLLRETEHVSSPVVDLAASGARSGGKQREHT